MNADYDYIIAGAGCAGLSLAVRIVASEALRQKKILIVDRSSKKENDRTWCFWEEGDGFFESIVYKEWLQLQVSNSFAKKDLDIRPYRYKLIRGIDFYDHCTKVLSLNSNVTFVTGEISNLESGSGIAVDGKTFTAQYVFSSIFEKPDLRKNQYWMLQHFKGIYIKTNVTAFNPLRAVLMDFDTPQHDGTTFFYVLPFSETEALVEYTLFSPKLLASENYDEALRKYISKKLQIDSYEIVHSEFGVIPMTNYQFPAGHGNLVNIGTAGGQTKGSSGYTFQYVQKHSDAIVNALEMQTDPKLAAETSKRHKFYDSVLLNILHNRSVPGDEIFMQLFQRNKASKIFKFLDNETSVIEDLKIISSLPTLPFSKAAIRQLFP